MLLNNLNIQKQIQEETDNELFTQYKKEIVSTASKSVEESDTFDKMVNIHNISFPVYTISNNESVKEMFNIGGKRVNYKQYSGFNNIANNKIKITTVTIELPLKEAIEKAYEIRDGIENENSEDYFFGSLLTPVNTSVSNDHGIVNPFHPIALLFTKYSLDTNKFPELNKKKYNLNIYTIPKDKLSKHEITNKDKNNIKEEITTLIKALRRKKEITEFTKDVKLGSDRKIIKSIIQYDEEGNEITGDTKRRLYSVIPGQVLIKNRIIYPYNAILGMRDGLGINLSIFVHPNVKETFIDSSSKKLTFTNVCAGNNTSTSLEGKQNENHCNLDSPYNSSIMPKNFIEYIKIFSDIAEDIWFERISMRSIDEPIVIMNYNEFKVVFPDASLNEYLTYIKDQ